MTPPASTALHTYGDYTRFGQRAAGQLWADSKPATQFAWTPDSATIGRISWGDPAAWPPVYSERFVRDGDWLLLEGYADDRNFLAQTVDQQWAGPGTTGTNMTPLATDGRQKYARWTIPASPYCLKTEGHMDYQGVRINFEHTQVYWPPSGVTCSNRYHTGQTCLKMHERWSDDNGSPMGEKIRRDVILAKGKGWFILHDLRTGRRADGRHYWIW